MEEAVQGHPDLSGALAFSAPHGLYQEAVGVLLVHRRRRVLDLPRLHRFLDGKLHRSKVHLT